MMKSTPNCHFILPTFTKPFSPLKGKIKSKLGQSLSFFPCMKKKNASLSLLQKMWVVVLKRNGYFTPTFKSP